MQVHYVYTNILGCEAGRLIYDGGAMIASNGTIVARSKDLVTSKVIVLFMI